MSKRLRGVATAMMLAAIASLLSPAGALAQAGSVGGTIGNNHSVSGGSERPSSQPAPQPHNVARPTRPARVAATSISGVWSWHAKCNDGSLWTGTFTIRTSPGGEFSGTSSGNDNGAGISGNLMGNKLTFTRQYPAHSTVWTAIVAGDKMHGSEASRDHGRCPFEAARN